MVIIRPQAARISSSLHSVPYGTVDPQVQQSYHGHRPPLPTLVVADPSPRRCLHLPRHHSASLHRRSISSPAAAVISEQPPGPRQDRLWPAVWLFTPEQTHLPPRRPSGRRSHVLRADAAGPDPPGPRQPSADCVSEQWLVQTTRTLSFLQVFFGRCCFPFAVSYNHPSGLRKLPPKDASCCFLWPTWMRLFSSVTLSFTFLTPWHVPETSTFTQHASKDAPWPAKSCWTGNADGLGETRKKELVKSGLMLGVRSESMIHVVESECVYCLWQPVRRHRAAHACMPDTSPIA